MTNKLLLVLLTLMLALVGCKEEPIRTFQLPKQTVYVARVQSVQELGWHAPKQWIPQTAPDMVLEQYLLNPNQSDSDQQKQVHVSVSSFPGDVGGLVSNINRWRGQLNVPAIKHDERNNYIQLDKTLTGIPYSHISLENKSGDTIQVIVLPFEEKTYFFKLTGKSSVVAPYQQAFMAFIKDIHVENH